MHVVVALDPYGADHAVEQTILDEVDARVEVVAEEPPARARQLQRAAGLLVVDHRVDAALLETTPACRVVATYGVGTDNIDVAAAERSGIVVANVPDYCSDEVAEHTLALWLACERRVVRGHDLVRRGGWDSTELEPIRRLRGLTFGLVGFGRIARQVALRLQGFRVNVIAHDPAVSQPPVAHDAIELVDDLDALLDRADVVSLHVPLTPETTGLLDARAISRLKPGCVVINTARGGLVDEDALMEALRDGRVGAAGLDALIEEPPVDGTINRGPPNLVLTPHIGFLSTEAVVAAKRGAAEAIARVLRGATTADDVA